MNPDDPRVQRTRDRLRAALLSLAARHDLGSVTMAAVARQAGINRATVYQHYADLDALVADAMDGAVTHVARCAALCPLDQPRDRAPEPLVDLFTHVADNAVLYRRMLSGQGSARFSNLLRQRLTEALAERFTAGARPSGFDDVPVTTHAAYLAGALVGVVAVACAEPEPPAEHARDAWRLLVPAR
ncbi:TetR/AcrR family transcriptional regulator [Nocardiopsis ganjiahuensis]|uniref:TetR/AcrR family transcriptional regulator n=1 Tax=Nocardiopsis ganjiahuensis TaxID=239984 RepID=UPI00034D433D|nr:TetR/AcrR family transcriptional regulator [Nocardiopsis ganjiahuensis]